MVDSINPFRKTPNLEQTSDSTTKSKDHSKSKKVEDIGTDNLRGKESSNLDTHAKRKIVGVHKKEEESNLSEVGILHKALTASHEDWQKVAHNQYPTQKDIKKAIDFLQMYAANFLKKSPPNATTAIASLERIKGEVARENLPRERKELIFDDIAQSFQAFNALIELSTDQQRDDFEEDVLKANKALNEFFNSLPNEEA